MANLWGKESGQSGSIYVNLFASVPEKSENRVDNEWKNPNLYRSLKDNQYSTELRMKAHSQFRAGCWTEAMQLYNESLCFAEIDSENVALAYANRSACFFSIQKYKNALIDIELAKHANVGVRFLSKLNERKLLCEKLMNSVEKPCKAPMKLNFQPNESYPCLSNVVKLKYNNEFGRHLVANCNIETGQTILIESDFVSMRSTTKDELVCSTCFQSNANFIACTQCPDVVFCSRACIDQNATHKWECGTFFAHLHYYIRFQMQATLQAIATFSSVESLMEFVENILNEEPEKMPSSLHDAKSKYHFFFKLQTSKILQLEHLIQAKQIFENLIMLPTINALCDSIEKQRFLMHLVVHHSMVIRTNGIVSGNPWSVVSVFNMLSMLNHSCAPNLYHPRKGKQQYCITIRPVKKGDQLFISYLSPNDQSTAEQRQLKLKSSWGFQCKCERCEPINQPISTTIITSDPFYRFVAENWDHENDSEKFQELLENCLKFLNKYGNSQWSTSIFTVTSILMNLYIEILLQK